MDNLNLGSDESVIHTTQRIIINGTGYEAVLTGSRLILIDSDSGSAWEDIPYKNIELATAATNRLREPVIRLTYSMPDDSARSIELIFIFLAAGRNFQNRDKCMLVLQKQEVPIRHDPTPADFLSRSKRDRMDAGTLDVDKPAGRPAVPEWTIYGPTQNKNPLPEERGPQSPLVTIIAVILIAVIMIGAMTAPIPGPDETQSLSRKDTGKTSVTATPSAVPTATPALLKTPLPETPSLGTIPGNGIWVKISYPGKYAGFLSAGGWRMDVDSSGTQMYQLPVHDTVIDGFIEKSDGSGDRLVVETYNGGVRVARHETVTPRGIVEMHIVVGPAIFGADVPVTEAPAVVVTPAAAPAPVQYAVPDTGVWVQVLYPGNYTGTISSNGQVRAVDASGDQIYQLVMNKGNIDSTLEKADGTTNPLEIKVYKDGVLVGIANTTVPKGIAEIHTTV